MGRRRVWLPQKWGCMPRIEAPGATRASGRAGTKAAIISERSRTGGGNPELMTDWACIDGNGAAARVAHRPSEVNAIYPITRASPMGELADVLRQPVPDPTVFERGNSMKTLRSYASRFLG